MSPVEAVTAFATVFLAELPDKTMVATLVLVARYRHPLVVWLAATAALIVHVTLAVIAGNALSRLPEWIVAAAAFVLFTSGAVVMLLAARRSSGLDHATAPDESAPMTPDRTSLRVFSGSFALVVLAEWGDLTQIATAGLSARSNAPVSTWLGAAAAMATVAGLACTLGRHLIQRIPVRRIHQLAASLFAALAVWAVVDLANSV